MYVYSTSRMNRREARTFGYHSKIERIIDRRYYSISNLNLYIECYLFSKHVWSQLVHHIEPQFVCIVLQDEIPHLSMPENLEIILMFFFNTTACPIAYHITMKIRYTCVPESNRRIWFEAWTLSSNKLVSIPTITFLKHFTLFIFNKEYILN